LHEQSDFNQFFTTQHICFDLSQHRNAKINIYESPMLQNPQL